MTHASVFSGIGGPEVAAAMLGWENLFHCEINPFGRKVLDYWYPNSESYEDITKTDFTEWRGRVNVLTGGFPCQPFSYAGQRRGAEDDRYLWPHMHRCINEIQPDWVVCENVAGILTMVEQGEVSPMESQATMFDEGDILRRYRLAETFTLERISRDLESDGYEVQSVLVPACAVGAPHRRDRVFIVGHRRDTILEDTMRRRHMERGNDKQGSERNERNTGARGGERICGETSGSAPADTSREGLERSGRQRLQESERGFNGKAYARRCFGDTRTERPQQSACGNRWRGFPSVSPVHRGNDGLPFPLDDLTISSGKWRTESLKAYGNAIVPQVMYEIFRAIEIVEQTFKPKQP